MVLQVLTLMVRHRSDNLDNIFILHLIIHPAPADCDELSIPLWYFNYDGYTHPLSRRRLDKILPRIVCCVDSGTCFSVWRYCCLCRDLGSPAIQCVHEEVTNIHQDRLYLRWRCMFSHDFDTSRHREDNNANGREGWNPDSSLKGTV